MYLVVVVARGLETSESPTTTDDLREPHTTAQQSAQELTRPKPWNIFRLSALRSLTNVQGAPHPS